MLLRQSIVLAVLALSSSLLLTMPDAVAAKKTLRKRKSSIASELRKAKAEGMGKDELNKLKKQLFQKQMTAKAAGVTFDTIQKVTAQGASLDEIRSRVNANNLKKVKKRGTFKKKEVALTDVLFPGASPIEYEAATPIEIIVDTVDSAKTQLPIDYYKLPGVCTPLDTKIKRRKRKNLGERLMGKSIKKLSPYALKVQQDMSCQVICSKDFTLRDSLRTSKLIEKQYMVNLSLDQLPVTIARSAGTVARGYPLGARLINEATKSKDYVLHNHLRFIIKYNTDDSPMGHTRIVGFSVSPVSINHDTNNLEATCGPDTVRNKEDTLLHISPKKGFTSERKKFTEVKKTVTYSYEVRWVKTDLPWTDRWDVYLLGRTDDSSAHQMSIMNGFMVVMFLGSVVAVILIRSLKRDIAMYNEISIDVVDDEEETGWKLVHGDVFRPPSTQPMALAVLVGSGAQIGISMLLTLIMCQTHIINPMKKGQALSTIVMLFVLSGSVAGYISSRLFKFTGGKNWKLNTMYTAAAFPGVLMTMFVCLNVFLACYGSTRSVSLFTIVAAFFLWLCVASPLVFVGSFFGFKKEPISTPTRTNQIARVVPGTYMTSNNFFSIIVGAMPFSTICIEFYFLLGAVWMNQYYFLMGSLLAIVVLVGVSSCLLAIVLCYVRLCCEDHRWWWKAFMDSASCALWLFGYSLWFVTFRMKLSGFAPVVVYVTYMGMTSVAVGLYVGSMSFLSTLWFVKKIYSTVKID